MALGYTVFKMELERKVRELDVLLRERDEKLRDMQHQLNRKIDMRDLTIKERDMQLNKLKEQLKKYVKREDIEAAITEKDRQCQRTISTLIAANDRQLDDMQRKHEAMLASVIVDKNKEIEAVKEECKQQHVREALDHFNELEYERSFNEERIYLLEDQLTDLKDQLEAVCLFSRIPGFVPTISTSNAALCLKVQIDTRDRIIKEHEQTICLLREKLKNK